MLLLLIPTLLLLMPMGAMTPDEAQSPKGVFVLEGEHPICVEFDDTGTFYLSTRPFHFTRGTYEHRDDQLVCSANGKTITFSRRDGKLVDEKGRIYKPREQCLAAHEADCSELVVAVVNSDTSEPVTAFQYSAEIQTDRGSRSLLTARPTSVESPDGMFRIMAPSSCLLRLEVSGPDVLNGFGAFKSIQIHSTDLSRRVEVKVEVGDRVSGVVLDAETGEPIVDAQIAPMVSLSPIFAPDREREVVTNARGEFVLYGVDTWMGIHAQHDAYFGTTLEQLDQVDLKNVTIELRRGPSITGRVVNAEGVPIAGALVSDGYGKKVPSAADGTFELKSPARKSNGPYQFEVECAGYQNRTESVSPSKMTDLQIVLKRRPVLRGVVRTATETPLKEFEISVGVGSEPFGYNCSSHRIQNEGAFEITVPVDERDREQRFWIGVKAEGFAFWDSELPRWEGGQTVEVILKEGRTVSGRIANVAQFKGRIEVHLLSQPRHDPRSFGPPNLSMRQSMSRMSVAVSETGDFSFTHVTPGRYVLAISGTSVSPFSTILDVADVNCDAGEISLRRTGSISGIVWNNPASSEEQSAGDERLPSRNAFAEGTLYFSDSSGLDEEKLFPHLAPRSFRTDERGRFRIENVPVGRVTIGLPKWMTADIISEDRRIVGVVENENTEVEFFSPALRERIRGHIVVGDGSPGQRETGFGPSPVRDDDPLEIRRPRFAMSLELLDDHNGSIPDEGEIELQTAEDFVISDVSPGDYDLVISDFLPNRRYPLEYFRTRIHVGEDPVDVQIQLGAGSLTGVIEVPKELSEDVVVMAVGQTNRQLRITECERDGTFCLRYLGTDTFLIYARSKHGWCQLPQTAVKENHQDLGTHRLQRGSTLQFLMPATLSYDRTVSVVAEHESGATSERLTGDQLVYGPTEFHNLCPGHWEFVVRRGSSELIRKAVRLDSDGVARIDLQN